MADDGQMIRVRVPDDVKARWDAAVESRQISTQRALVRLMDWVAGEDPLTQAMIFGQVPGTDQADLSAIVLRRLAESAKGKGRGKRSA